MRKTALRTSVRYCTHLKRNVIILTEPGIPGGAAECLNRPDCGYYMSGCRNSLICTAPTPLMSGRAEIGGG